MAPSIGISNGTNGTNGTTRTNGSSGIHDPELHKILPNTLYLTFNAPQVNEYHRGIFLTYPPSLCTPIALFSGTLFHASYINDPSPHWVLEDREVKDLSNSKSLVLLYRIESYNNSDMAKTSDAIGKVLRSVPLGKEARSKEIPGEVNGNSALGGYDCVIWTNDALEALIKNGLADFKGSSVEEIMAHARALAGPKDATTMVGVDVGGFRVIN